MKKLYKKTVLAYDFELSDIRPHIGEHTKLVEVPDPIAVKAAVKSGLGIGFLAEHEASQDLDLVEIASPSGDWSVPIWLVTHVDLHRTGKVQRFLREL